MAHQLKVTASNIIGLWFGADTPLRQYKIQSNPVLWDACLRAHIGFVPPSGAASLDQYRKSDKNAFARAVERELTPSATTALHEPV